MSDYTNDAIYGYTGGNTLGADMLNPSAAQGFTDWGAILANGIRGAAQGAIGGMVNNAYASGQLQQQAIVQQRSNSQFMTLLIIGAVIYAVTR
jgi:hypothetical protein